MADNLTNLAKTYRENLRAGYYTLPLLFELEDLLIHRYGDSYVDMHIDFKYDASKYRIKLSNLDSTKTFLTLVEFYKDRLEEKFNSTDLFLGLFPVKTYHIRSTCYIKKDKFTISNSRGSQHSIEGLYVVLELREDLIVKKLFILEDLMTIRNRFVMKEMIGKYSHSHARSLNIGPTFTLDEPKTMCLGNSPFSRLHGTIEAMGVSDVYEDFIPYLTFLDEYLLWESLEGIPYRYIDDLNSGNADNNLLTVSSSIQNPHYNVCNIETGISKSILALLKTSDIKAILQKCKIVPGFIADQKFFRLKYDEYDLQVFLYSLVLKNYLETQVAPNNESLEELRIARFNNTYGTRIITKDNFRNVKYSRKSNQSSIIDTIRMHLGKTVLTFKGNEIPLEIVDFNDFDTTLLNKDQHCLTQHFLLALITILENNINYELSKQSPTMEN